jgi:histidine ammonia-lyase
VVTITEDPLALEELLAVARGASVELGAPALERIRAGRAVVDAALGSGEPVYGLNTGLGHMKDVRLGDEELARFQEMMLASHAGGLEPYLPVELVRAAMAVRVNGIARGGSGASEAAAQTLVAMLNRGVHPRVPAIGSVGAADLPQMASIALVAIGRGHAVYDGETLAGRSALERAGITPHALQPKDGLTLMSANGVSIGHGAFVIEGMERLADLVDRAAALSLEAVGGNASIVHPTVGAAKPFGGQLQASLHITSLLEGSYLLAERAPSSVQDALSFRVVPQVHGALREFIASARDAVEVELNSQSDNPLVSVDEGAMIHNGNFHPAVMALGFDALRIALAHVVQLSERRMSHLWDAAFASPSFGARAAAADPRDLAGLAQRYPAAAMYAELRGLAAPATLDVPPLDIGVEDHATAAPLTVRVTERALVLAEDIVVIEMMLARGLLLLSGAEQPLGRGSRACLEAIAATYADLQPAAAPADVHVRVRTALRDALPSG